MVTRPDSSLHCTADHPPYNLETRQVRKRYGAVQAVDGVTLQVRQGEFFSILGPSGAGKTSLLRMLAGFEFPDEGEIIIAGRSMDRVPPNRRPVNLVFQSYALFPHLTVQDNIAFGLRMQQIPKSEIAERVHAACDLVRLLGKETRFPLQLSGGEQQRVALARALVNRPAVVLLDEPLAALDEQLRREMQMELRSLRERAGTTFVCVTHHQEEAIAMSDRMGVMHEGRLVQIGRPQEIYEHPASAFVAQFVGEANEVAGRLQSVSQGTGEVSGVDHAWPTLRIVCPPGLSPGQHLSLFLRPERLRVTQVVEEGEYENSVAARVDRVVYCGNEIHYLLDVSQPVRWKATVVNHHGDQKVFSPGEPVFVQWRAADTIALAK